MSDIAIRVGNLSKRYRIGLKEEVHNTLVGTLADFITRPVKNLQRLRELSRFQENGESPKGTIWALKEISFEVKRGEVLGIIGSNGAGKSTLLKILSRITEPTRGAAEIYGRVGSLLEVGTGFHPELTARDNIYLNGTLLGMRKAEIDRKFDQIVAFSGVEKFLDTPAKRYSSGMQVRLAFSVAAHLEAEILLMDEVLAVGDAEFQRKCLGKMEDVTKEGRTILFVSHNMAAIRNLCRRTLLVQQGRLAMDAPTEAVLEKYLGRDQATAAVLTAENLERKATIRGWDPHNRPDVIRCKEVRLLGPDGCPRTEFRSDEEITLEVVYECLKAHSDFRIIVSVVDDDNVPILTTQNVDDPAGSRHYRLETGVYRSSCVFPRDVFGERRFHVSLSLIFPHIDQLVFEKIVAFTVAFAGYNNIQYLSKKESFLRPRLKWQTDPLSL